MAYQNNNGFQGERRELIDVSGLGITCGECGTKIEKLPFQPTEKQDGTYGRILCYTCIKKRPRKDFQPRANFGGGGFHREYREN